MGVVIGAKVGLKKVINATTSPPRKPTIIQSPTFWTPPLYT